MKDAKQGKNDNQEIEPTPTQRQILQYIANGCKQEQVAEVLRISHETVRTQLKLLRRRLNVNTLEQAVALAAKRGWVKVDDYPRLRHFQH
jgi:DNA-binding CsgD family transcriptional regulator